MGVVREREREVNLREKMVGFKGRRGQPMRMGQHKQGMREMATHGGVRCVRVGEGK